MDKTDRISFSFSFDLANQNKLLKDPGQLYIAKTINIIRFLADVYSILAYFRDHLGMIWACSGGSLACFSLEKATYINFQKIFFFLSVGRVQKKIVRCVVWFRCKNKF